MDPYQNKGPAQKPQSQIKEFGDLFALADQSIKVTAKKQTAEYGYNPLGSDAFAGQSQGYQPQPQSFVAPAVALDEQKAELWSATVQEKVFAEPLKETNEFGHVDSRYQEPSVQPDPFGNGAGVEEQKAYEEPAVQAHQNEFNFNEEYSQEQASQQFDFNQPPQQEEPKQEFDLFGGFSDQNQPQ